MKLLCIKSPHFKAQNGPKLSFLSHFGHMRLSRILFGTLVLEHSNCFELICSTCRSREDNVKPMSIFEKNRLEKSKKMRLGLLFSMYLFSSYLNLSLKSCLIMSTSLHAIVWSFSLSGKAYSNYCKM